MIGRDIAAVAKSVPLTSGALVIDPFTGSANTLYWVLRHLPCARGFGFEQDPIVFQLTSRNLATLHVSIEVSNRDYMTGLSDLTIAPNQLVIAFIAPPWGDALNKSTGLDLRRTTPPITEIVDFLIGIVGQNPLLCAIQVYETLVAASLEELTPRFSWSAQRMYGLNAPGQNHGILMGTRGWAPRGASRSPAKSNRSYLSGAFVDAVQMDGAMGLRGSETTAVPPTHERLANAKMGWGPRDAV